MSIKDKLKAEAKKLEGQLEAVAGELADNSPRAEGQRRGSGSGV